MAKSDFNHKSGTTCLFCVPALYQRFFLDDASKSWIFGPKTQYLAPKRPAEGTNVVLPEMKSYLEIAWDMATTLYVGEVCRSPKMEVYGLTLKKIDFWGQQL